MVEIATLDLHRFGIHNRLDQIVMHLVTEQKCQYSYLSEVTLLISRVLVWITYKIAYLLHIYIYVSLVNVVNHFPEITRFAAFCATVGLWDANGGSKISTAMGHCSNSQERMDKRCERWVFCEYGCHSIFWEISVYIYMQSFFVFYTYYDPTDPFLSLWKPTKKWKNISQRAHWWCHVQDFDGFDQFSGWVVFFVSTCSPPKTPMSGRSSWRKTILRREVHAHVYLIFIVHTWRKTSL